MALNKITIAQLSNDPERAAGQNWRLWIEQLREKNIGGAVYQYRRKNNERYDGNYRDPLAKLQLLHRFRTNLGSSDEYDLWRSMKTIASGRNFKRRRTAYRFLGRATMTAMANRPLQSPLIEFGLR
ncbi:MAG: hypothetical protein ABWX70_05700 [Hyphomicrobium sp.]